jgi:Secretion system C-terminal sorting domain
MNCLNKKIYFVLVLLFLSFYCEAQTGITWNIQSSASDNNWSDVTYGNGLFVAVSGSGSGNRVMTSPNGINWTSRTSAADNNWRSVVFGNSIFVAVGSGSGLGNRVMTSPDGITWTSRSSVADIFWSSVAFGNGVFVAVSSTATAANVVMTSPDGINWTSRTPASPSESWNDITFGAGLFVAVASTNTGNRVMTSPDGITWTSRTSAADNAWVGVTFGNSLFVAVSNSGTGNRVMTSPNGINWTIRTSANDNAWKSVSYGAGLFVAVSTGGTGNRVMTSPDAISWTIRTSAADNSWSSITFANGIFVAVAGSGTGNRVMTSGSFSALPIDLTYFKGENKGSVNILEWETAAEFSNSHFTIEKSLDGKEFVRIGTVNSFENSRETKKYSFNDYSQTMGLVYYRLKQTDLNGSSNYFQIIAIKSKESSSKIFPNPSKDGNFTLILPNFSEVIISNLYGQIISNFKVDFGTYNLQFNQPSGIYFLKIVTENGESTQRLIVE